MKSQVIFALLTLALCRPQPVSSQTNPQWMHFTNTDEVTGLTVRGNEIWAATLGGIVQYNLTSNEKRVYTRIDGLGSNWVGAISVAPNGRPWCTTYAQYGLGAGLYEFDGTRWSRRSSFSGLGNNIIHDRSGNLWMVEALNLRAYVYTNSGQLEQPPLSGWATCVAVDRLDRPWFGMWNSGAYVKNGTQWIQYDTTNSGIGSNVVQAISADNLNRVWFAHPNIHNPATPAKGISMFDGTTWHRYNTSNSNLPSNEVRLLVADSSGNVYALCLRECAQLVIRFDGTSWQSMSGADTTNFSSNNGADGAVADNNGSVYFGTRPNLTLSNGLFRYSGGGNIRRYNSVSGWSQVSISSNTLEPWGAWQVSADSSGSTWIGSLFGPPKQVILGRWTEISTVLYPSATAAGIATEPNGTTWLVGGTWSVSGGCGPGGVFQGGAAAFDGSHWRVFGTHNSGLPSNSLTCVLTDASGIKWFGTYDRGVTTFDNTTWTTYDTINSGLRNNWVMKSAQDRSGRIWFATYRGLCSFAGGLWRTESFSAVDMCRDYQGNVWFIAAHFDQLYNRWFADSLLKFNGSLMSTFALPSGFGNLTVSSISVSTDQKVWIGIYSDNLAQGRGVYSFDGTNWTTYSFTNSLIPYPSISAVFADLRGNKWFASSQPQGGLAVYNENGVNLVPVEESQTVPSSYSLLQNYPNPFNPSTTIRYHLPKRTNVSIRVFDLLGRLVATPFQGVQEAGEHETLFQAAELASGLYVYQLSTDTFFESKKMLLLR